MLRVRRFAVTAATLLLVIQVTVLLVSYGSDAASVWGDWLDAIAPFVAGLVCWLVSRHAGPYGRRAWRLVSLSAVLGGVGQSLYTYDYDYLHASLGTLWPSDFLVFFWIVPAMMTLFLSVRDPSGGLRWLRALDFVQVCTLVLAVELSQIYVPSRWQASGQSMEVRALYAGIFFYGLLALSFVLRGRFSVHRVEKAFFTRMSFFLVLYAVVLNVTLQAQSSGYYRQGTWLDFAWTFSYCLLIVLPTTWNVQEENPTGEAPSSTMQLLAMFAPLVIPAVTFPLLFGVAQEQLFCAVVLVLISFAAAGGRMFVVQRELMVSSRELQKNLALLKGITEGTTDAVYVKDRQGRYLMINSAAANFVGKSVAEILGKDDSELFGSDTAGVLKEADRRVIASGATQTFEERATSGGISRLYLSTKGPYRSAQGEIVGLLGISRDITDRKRAEEEVRQSQQKLRIHFDHTPLGVVEWDLEFCVTNWNPAAERIFGYSREEAMGRQGHFIVP
ncbi:MAG TPA: PAS domain-containing protein, partial [Candidatus Binatia bacterium]|nr:PAS domain-containing protein [Candidatus Binatia bacterium]